MRSLRARNSSVSSSTSFPQEQTVLKCENNSINTGCQNEMKIVQDEEDEA